jgi:hypothetical protein
MSNMFDLKKLIPGGAKPSVPYVHTYSSGVNSDSEKAALLTNYVSVDKENWEKIAPGTHIRYENSDGEFKRGGFIARHYVSVKEENAGHKLIRMRSTPAKGGKEWSIDLANVSQIWKNSKFEPKPSQSDVVGGIQTKTDSLAAQIEQLRVELAHLSNEQKRTIALIKKLHNIQV